MESKNVTDTGLRIGPVLIHEPFTLLIDSFTGILCVWFGINVLPIPWKVCFFLLGVSFMLGGLAHAFDHYTSIDTHKPGRWIGCIAVMVIECIAVSSLLSTLWQYILFVFIFTKFIYISWMLLRRNAFRYVMVHSVIGLLGIAVPIFLLSFRRTGNTAFVYIAFGFILQLIPAGIFLLHRPFIGKFDTTDLSHLSLIPCLFVLYHGVGLIQ